MKRSYEQESLRWFTQATDEFRDADELRERGRFYLALFHFQQAAEKALKAYLLFKVESVQVYYTHSLDELIRLAIESDGEFGNIAAAKKLDQYYIPTRYPNGLPGGVPSRYYDDPAEAEQAMRLAKNLIELVREKIEAEP
jgi:HEPN domain-containing protein